MKNTLVPENESNFRGLFESGMLGLFFWDLNGNILAANDSFFKTVGYSKTDFKANATSLSQMTPSEYHVLDERALSELDLTGSCIPYEKEYFKKDGSRVSVLVGGATINGDREKRVGFVIDLSGQKQSDLYRSKIQEISRLGTWELDLQTQKLFWSKEMLRIFGMPPQKAPKTFKDSLAYVFSEDRDEASDAQRQIIVSKKSYSTEYRIIRSDASIRYLEVIGVAILDNRGEVVKIFGTAQDITEKKLKAIALNESEQRFKATFSQAAVGIAHVSTTGKWLQVNEKLCEIVGYTREELLQITFQEITYPEDLERDLGFVRQVLAGEIQTYSMEKRFVRKDRSLVWINLTVSLIRDAESNPKYFISVVEDISRRKSAEADLIKLNEGLESRVLGRTRLINLSKNIAILSNESVTVDVAIQGVLDRICDYLKWPVGHAFLSDEDDFLTFYSSKIWSRSACDSKYDYFRSVTENGKYDLIGCLGRSMSKKEAVWITDLENESSFSRKETLISNGFVSAFAFPICIQESVIGVLEFFSKNAQEPDSYFIESMVQIGTQLAHLIERNRAAATIAEQQKAMLYSSRMSALGEMAGGVAHEINNPLQIILGNALLINEALTKTPIDQNKIAQYAQSIFSTSVRISEITKGLRAFAREGTNDPFAKTAVKDLLESTLVFCQERFAHHHVNLRKPEISNDLFIECRESQISQVLLNLLNNAFQAAETSDQKWVEIQVHEKKSENTIEIRILDSGSGMPEEVREKIFQPFFTTKPVGQGTGLGLSISKGIIDSHHGSIFLDTTLSVTCMAIILPKNQNSQR